MKEVYVNIPVEIVPKVTRAYKELVKNVVDQATDPEIIYDYAYSLKYFLEKVGEIDETE